MAAVLGAGALSREHEGATWESLRLSLLSPREILWGKMGAPLLVCGVCGLIFMPIVLPCVRSVAYSGPFQGGISITQFIAAIALVFSCAWCSTLLGLLFSQYSRRTVSGICWTTGTLFVMLIAAPSYISSLGGREMETLMTTWHPLLAIINVFDRRNRYSVESRLAPSGTLESALPCVLLLLFIGGVCALFVLRSLYVSRKSDVR